MKRNSTSIKHHHIGERQWGERPSAPVSETFVKGGLDLNLRPSANPKLLRSIDPPPQRNEYYSNFNLREQIPPPVGLTTQKSRDDPNRVSQLRQTEAKTRTSSFRPSIKRRSGYDSIAGPDIDTVPSINGSRTGKKPRMDSETKTGHRAPSRGSLASELPKRTFGDQNHVQLPKVTVPEKVSRSIQVAKNSSAALSSAFKELANLTVQQMQTYSSQHSFLSSNSSDFHSAPANPQTTKNQAARKSKLLSENTKPPLGDGRSVSSEPTQPHISLNAGLANKTVSLMPARCSSFLFNGREALYSVNTTNGLIRTYNEDRVSIVINIKRKLDWKQSRWPNCSYFSIFDGHGGALCADFLKDNLHKLILESPHFPDNPAVAIEQGCAQAEHDFCKFALRQTNIEKSGSCGIVVLIIDDRVYIGNVGDSRAIVSEFGGKVTSDLTRDHKPEEAREKERIEKAGGKVMKNNYLDTYKFLMPMLNNRLNELPFRLYPGGLSVSRSFGDITAKDLQLGGNPNVLIAKPDIFVYTVEKKTDFIFIGCELTRRRHLRQVGHPRDLRSGLGVPGAAEGPYASGLANPAVRGGGQPGDHLQHETAQL